MYLQIKPKEIFRKGIATQLGWVVTSYERNDTSMQVSWSLFDNDKQQLETGTETIDASVVANWNTTDAVIDEAIIKIIGVELEK